MSNFKNVINHLTQSIICIFLSTKSFFIFNLAEKISAVVLF